MDRETLLRMLRQHQPDLDRLGVTRLGVFGSFARDQATADSDVDLLVEMSPPYTFDRFTNLMFYLEELLDRRVDLVFPEKLRSNLQIRIHNEIIYV